MESKPRCQSCGMPLGAGFYGTDANGSESQIYCKFCFQKGLFTKPQMTLEKMIQLSIDNMTGELHMPLEKATKLANSVIPKLKRWEIA